MPDYTRFKGVLDIGDAQLTTQLQSNMVEFCNWGMLCIGAFYNVHLTDRLGYGGNPSILRLSDDRRYAPGLIWEGYRGNWVWEQNIEYHTQPITISGIYVNNTFYSTGTSDPTYSYNINYPFGQIVFNNPISTNSVVQLEYSFHQYGFYTADVQWFRSFLDGLSRIDDDFNWSGSGIRSFFADNRVGLPAIIVESFPNRDFSPLALGGGQWCHQDIYFHIYADKSIDRNNMVDILSYQKEKRFFLFDQNAMASSGTYPLNVYGNLVNPQYNYPYLVDHFLWRSAIIMSTKTEGISNESNLFLGNVRMNLELEFPEL